MTDLSSRVALRTAGTGALLALLVTVGAPPATAHDQLVDSSPTEGEHFDVAPTEISLRFSEEILTIGPAVIVVDDAGDRWTDGDPVLEGPNVVADLVDDLPDGSYQVRWRVVSSDGHPISDAITFTVGEAAAVPTAAPSPSSGPTTGPTSQAVSSETTSDSSPAWVRPVLVGAGGAIVASALFWTVARASRRRPSPPGNTSH